MKKEILLGLIFILALPVVFAKIEVNMATPTSVGFNQSAAFKIIVSSTEEKFDIAQIIPAGWQIISWGTEGIAKEELTAETKEIEYAGNPSTAYHWASSKAGTFNITFTLVPLSFGQQEITTLWVYPGSFDSKSFSINVWSQTICGNGICESALGENSLTCPADCKPVKLSLFWVILLVAATFIAISGIAYREYLMYWLKKPRKHKIKLPRRQKKSRKRKK